MLLIFAILILSSNLSISLGNSITLDNGKIQISYQNYGTQTEFTVSSPIENGVSITSAWLGLGLNLDRSMPGANVVMCKNQGGVLSVEHYYNDNLNPVYMDTTKKFIGLSSLSVHINGSIMTCKFTRDNTNSNSRYLDLNTKQLYIMAGYGSLTADQPQQHVVIKETTNIVEFPVQTRAFDSTTLDNGKIQITFKNYGTQTEFTVSSPIENGVSITSAWLGLGLNLDRSMPGANVVMCKNQGGVLSVEHYYNDNLNPVYMDSTKKFIGLSSLSVHISGSIMTCKFTRDNTNSNSRYLDLNTKQLYIMAGYGSLTADQPEKHVVIKETKNIVEFPVKSNETLSTTTVKASTIQTTTKETTTTSVTTVPSNSQNGQYSLGDYNLLWNDFQTYTAFTFSTKADLSDNFYSSFAFSLDNKMGSDDVVVCKITQSKLTVERYYNEGKNTPSYLDSTNPTIGLSDIKISISNGVLLCSFNRQKSMSITNYFDLANKYYLLFAKGSITNGVLQFHSNKIASSSLVDFTTSLVFTSSSSIRSSPPQTSYTANGTFDSGEYSLKWSDSTYYTKFDFNLDTTKSKRAITVTDATDQYIAIGFSKDKSMGDDNVILCKVSNQIGTVQHMYNRGKNMPEQLDPNSDTTGLSEINVQLVNNQLVCSFKREKYIASVANYFDLNEKFYLLSVKGGVSGGQIQYHGQNYAISDTTIDIKSGGQYSGSSSNNDKAKAHAILMIFAWMFLVSTGIIFARYYKFIFPDIKIADMAFWFNVHRLFMIMVPIISFVSFMVILSDLDWKWVESSQAKEFAHSIIGIVTIGLSIIQVIGAFFRPDKDAPMRPVFNIIHRSTGVSCFVFAIVTIYLGVFMDRMNLGKVGWGILVGWTAWVVFFALLIEILTLLFKEVPRVQNIKTLLLAIYIFVALTLTIALMSVTGKAQEGTYQ